MYEVIECSIGVLEQTLNKYHDNGFELVSSFPILSVPPYGYNCYIVTKKVILIFKNTNELNFKVQKD